MTKKYYEDDEDEIIIVEDEDDLEVILSDHHMENAKRKYGNGAKKRRSFGVLFFNNDKLYFRWIKEIGLMIGLLFAILLIALLLPGNRQIRNLNKADSYYSQMKYAKAEKKYKSVIEINRKSPKGYLGVIKSMLADEDPELKERFTEYAEILLSVENPSANEYAEWEEFFLLVNEIYADSPEIRRDILKRAYEKLGEPEGLKISLADALYEYGIVTVKSSLDEGVEAFNEALILSDFSEGMTQNVKSIIETYIYELIERDAYDDAYGMLDIYAEPLNLDYETVNYDISNAENLYNIKCVLMMSVGEIMAPYFEESSAGFNKEYVESLEGPLFGIVTKNWTDLLALDGSEEADLLAYSFERESYIYADGGFKEDYTGVGCGLYTYGDVIVFEDGSRSQGYYFYYGEYKNGVRDGYGYLVAQSGDNSYVAFEGIWKNDAPNGFGVMYEEHMYSSSSAAEYTQVIFGEFKDGLQNGEMKTNVVLNSYADTYFAGSYGVTDGYPEELEGVPSDYGIVDYVPENRVLYACLPSAKDGYDFFVPLYSLAGSKLGVLGFTIS